MGRRARPKLKMRDLRGRAPEAIIRAHVKAGDRPIFPYSIVLDLHFCYQHKDWDGIRDICRYRDDRMELLRHRDPVTWAYEILKRKAKE